MSQYGNLHAARSDPDKERYHNELYARQLAMSKAIFAYFKRPEAPEEKLDDVIQGCYNLPETVAYKIYGITGAIAVVGGIEDRLRTNIIRSVIRDAFQVYLRINDDKARDHK